MFALDRSRHFVEATEREITAIFRSAAAVTISPPGLKATSSEAFICVVKKDDTSHVYVALAEPGNKKALIFAQQRDSDSLAAETENDQIGNALSFTGSMGFTMDSVNLDYGRALREVVVRSIRVISDPENGHKAALEKRAPVLKPADFTPAATQQLTRKDAAGSAGEFRSRENIALEKHREKPSAEKVQPGVAGQKVMTGEPPDAKKEAKGRKKLTLEEAEREKLVAEKRAAEAWAEEQAEVARKALMEVAAERKQREALVLEKAAAEKRAAEELETARHARELVEAERLERERVLAEKLAAERRAEEQAEIARCALREAEAERVERARLAKEKIEAEKRAEQALEAERRARVIIENERIEQERMAAGLAAAQKAAADNAERDRLAAESERAECMEQREANRIALEKAEADRTKFEMVLAAKAEAERVALATADAERLAYLESEAEFDALEIALKAITATEKALAEQVESERDSWHIAEADRVESERLLSEKVTLKKSAEEKVQEAISALEKVEAERKELESVLADKASAAISAAERIESARSSWEKAEASRIDLERKHGRTTQSKTVARERAETVRLQLETAKAERVEREKLLADAVEAERVARVLAEAGGKAADEVVNAEKESCPDHPGNAYSLEHAEARVKVAEAETALFNPETLDEKAEAEGPAQSPSDAAMAGADPHVTARRDGDAAGEVPVIDVVGENANGRECDVAAPVERPSFGETAVNESVRQLLELNRSTSHTDNGVAVCREQEHTSVLSSAMSVGSPFFDCGESAPTVGFAIDASLPTIRFHEQKQIRSLHQSLNSVRLSIGEYPSQSCVAWLCAIEDEETFFVFFGLHLNESRKNIIYRSGREPANMEECTQFVQDGIGFAETVGFMMDSVDLGNASLKSVIDAIPVLTRSDAVPA